MIRPNIWALLLLATLFLATSQTNYKKVVHNFDPEAKCLDGTPGLLYVHEGGDTKNILIFFEGGGLCGAETLDKTLQSCYERTKNILGSSKYWPEEFPADAAQGYLSLDPNVNKFANWTKFIFGYCDGSLHQGFAADPIKYKGIELYFRGAAISRSHFAWIHSKYDFKGAEKVILTGASAGGIGVNIWSNYVKAFVGDQSKVYSIADSGVFMNFKNYWGDPKIEKEISNIYKVANTDESTPVAGCNAAHPGQEWKCLFIENSYPFITGKFMIINSEYDAYSIPNILGFGCLRKGVSGETLTHCSQKELAYIEEYRQFYRGTLAKFLTVNPESSIWSVACANHGYASLALFYDSPFQKIPTTIGKTVRAAVEEFVLEDKRVLSFDAEGWPSNTGCAR
jgi:O-palmitoleoyl-L-serine hydrolase